MSQNYQSQWFLIPFKVALLLATASITVLPQSLLLAENIPSQNLEAASFFQQGVMRYSRKDLQAAEYAFRQALERDPNLAAARNYLGNIMLQQNRSDVAVQEYGEAIRINPSFVEPYYNLGLALHKQGHFLAAITAYRQALVIDPTMAVAQYNLGLALYEQGQLDEALAAYQQAINLDSGNANAYFNLAIALQQKGQTQEAIAAYRQVLVLNPDNAAAYNNMAGLLTSLGQDSVAIATYVKAIRRLPNNTAAYYNLGIILYNQGNYKNAKVVLKRARNQYREQGNIQQALQVEQLMQQIAQLAASKKTQVGRTPTSSVVIPESATPVETQNNPESVPISVPQIPPTPQKIQKGD